MPTSDKAQRKLDEIVDSVVENYTLGRPIDSLESTALPNKRKIVEAIAELEHVVYMGYYSTRVLSPANLRRHVGEHIHRAAETLIEQVARAVAYERRGGAPEASDFEWSEFVITDTLTEIPRLRDQLALDVQAAYDGDP